MGNERMSIGVLARRTGVPVKTLRYYSDEGLLPPASRSQSRYRLYDERAEVRVELIRSLREAGLGLVAIRKVLRRETSLADALRLQLAAVEAHVASLQCVAAALRAALRGEPTEVDVRRLCAVTKLSNEERKAMIQSFYDRVAEGIPIDEEWKKKMVEASSAKLPENPTPEQLDAWIELAGIVSDPKFVESLRANAKEVWERGIDLAALRTANATVAAEARQSRESGVAPESAEARVIIERYGAAMAAATGHAFDAEMRRGMRERFARQDPRASRYWELIAILNGTPSTAGTVGDWAWVRAAIEHHLR